MATFLTPFLFFLAEQKEKGGGCKIKVQYSKKLKSRIKPIKIQTNSKNPCTRGFLPAQE